MLQSSYYQIKTTLDAITNNSQELRDDDLRLQHESRGRTDAGMDRNVIVALQGQVTKMKKLLQSMALSQVDAVGNYVQAVKQVDEMRPVGCGEPHTTDACLLNAEIAAYVKSYPYSNTYNAGNYRGEAPDHRQRHYDRPHYSAPQHQQATTNTPSSFSSMVALLRKYMQRKDAFMQSQTTSIINLEIHLGQLAKDFSGRPHGSLPSNIEVPNHNNGVHKNKGMEIPRRHEQHDKASNQSTSSILVLPPPFSSHLKKKDD
ncbi:hypothetical protein E5676_scaffold306G00800 [Cucumis melo var. makuwa]|uniref:Uncharacterized protein n=1 Tax=Cucumis melo var. makuwa TaxID=1194695 RepID=A0A5D3D2S0_CUCMM|nr:hypothetical protein E6C27_scaffold333G00770 [Cucumis melo var. makuwa]TYK17828.1 hypothetical protein E5676_scaffold306G00800 [Cucumis melo var. makuwa]